MSILVILCFAFAALLGAIGAVYRPSPPPFNFIAGSVAFIALGLLLQVLIAGSR